MSQFSFDYRVRISKRARYSRIVIEPDASVEVVIPHGVHPRHVPLLLADKQQWIERTLQRFGGQQRLSERTLPETVALPLPGCCFSVVYRPVPGGRLSVRQQQDCVTVSGDIDDRQAVVEALRNWLKREARRTLAPMLAQLAGQYGFSYRAVSIRLQKRRWGSCSSTGRISLNAKLLFMQPDIVRHVLLHELVHLHIPNHSPVFWQRLTELDPDCAVHRKALHSSHLPWWVG